MRAVWFLIAAVGAASALIGALRAFQLRGASRWAEYGDGPLFWMTWAADPGVMRLVYAGVAALVVIALALLARKQGWAILAPFRWIVDGFGRWFFAFAAVLAAALPHVVWAMQRPEPEESPSVVFILLDTLRLDYVGWGQAHTPNPPELPGITPHLDQLAERGAHFTHAIAQAPWTKPSVGSMFTGLIPSRHEALGRPGRGHHPNLEPDRRTLAEAFVRGGYDTAAISTNPNISVHYGFDQGFQSHLDGVRSAEEVITEAKQWLAGREDPYFLYLHFNDAHYPFEPPEGFRGKYDRTQSRAQLDGPSESKFRYGLLDYSDEDMEHLRMAYAEEVHYLDAHVGRFVQELISEKEDLFVVIVSDHGEEFLEHGDLGHGHQVHDELTRTPLQFAWGSRLGQQPLDLKARQIDIQVRLVDLLPTLIDLAGLEWPAGAPQLDGESLLEILRGADGEDRPAFTETDSHGSPRSAWTGPLRSLRTPAGKVILNIPDPESSEAKPLVWHFDLDEDPLERRNRAGEARGDYAALLAELRGPAWWVDRPFPPKVSPREIMDRMMDEAPEMASELEELGYLDGLDSDEMPPIPPDPRAVPGQELQ